MRKVMILALLAAGIAAPTTAIAQRGNWRGGDEAGQQSRSERQQARQANRAERQQTRSERQQARQQQSAAREQRAPAPSSGTEWIGDRNDPRMEAHRQRYERLDRENARRNGTQQQYRALVEQQGSQRQARREERRDDRQDWRQDRRDDRRDWRNDRRDDRRDWRNDRRDDRRSGWNRGWRNDNRYDWQRYRNSNRIVFRLQPYYSPYRGYRYSRFSIGHVLDRLFWGQNYWISNPWTYRLPPAPYGTQWVRYYDDVVLVDTYTGEVLDVIHDFFW